MNRYLAVIMAMLLMVGVFAGCKSGGSTTNAQAFYKGQTVTYILSTNVGSGTDVTGRYLAPYLKDFLGATVVIDNKGQVGSLEGVNYVATTAKPDGLTFTLVASGALFPNGMLNTPGVQYDLTKLVYIADLGQPVDPVIMVNPAGPYKTVADMQAKKGLLFGGPAAQSTICHEAAMAIELLKLNGKIVTGFAGTAALILSTTKGELDAWTSPLGAAMISIQKKQSFPLIILTQKRNPLVPDVPAVGEMMTISPSDQALLNTLLQRPEGYTVVAPPGTPQDRVDFLRKAFDYAAQQKQFNSDIAAAWGEPMVYRNGAQLTTAVTALLKLKPDFQKIADLTTSLTK